jgi:hypothetical protein
MEIARRQLGTALWLFLEDLDPVSVHTLTGAGAELAEQLARNVGSSPFLDHVLRTNPSMTRQRYYALARQYYNAFKHLSGPDGAVRNDEALLGTFDDEKNDALMFVAWTDFTAASGVTPIEAQVFLVWFYASHPEKMAKREDGERFLSVFPRLSELDRPARKAALKAQIAEARKNAAVMEDQRTDRLPLIISGGR